VDKVVGYGAYIFKGVIVIRLQNDVLQRCMGKHNCWNVKEKKLVKHIFLVKILFLLMIGN